MSEALIRWLADRQSVAFLLLLSALVGVRSFSLIDGSQFMVGYLSLMAAFYGAVHFSTEKQGG